MRESGPSFAPSTGGFNASEWAGTTAPHRGSRDPRHRAAVLDLPDNSHDSDRLTLHLLTLAAAIQRESDLFVVLEEIDLRAHRDVGVRAVVDRVEQGWRHGLVAPLDHDRASVALVIATVKGARLDPATAADALTRLARLLTERSKG